MRLSLPSCILLLCLSGCAGPSHPGVAERRETYTDPASGVAFPKVVAGLDRAALHQQEDESDKVPVNAHYTRSDSPLDAAVRVIPSSQISPGQLLGETMQAYEASPNFTEAEYRGNKVFGNQAASCIQCSFDQPAQGARVTFKVVILPRSNFLVCFTFMMPSVQEQAEQGVIDGFIRQIVAASSGTVYMAPDFSVMKTHGDVEE